MVGRIDTAPNRQATELFDGLPARYDRLGALLSLGQDRRWRKEMVSHVVAGPTGRVLDVATGPAGVALAIRSATGAQVVGLDLTATMLARARQNLASRQEGGVHLVQGRGEELPFADEAFDAVSFTYLLRYVADPAATIAELARVLRPGGTLSSLEFHLPPSPLWRGLWWCYTRLVLPAAGWLTGGREWFEVGRFLGPNISRHYRRYPLAWTVEAWTRAGIDGVGSRLMSLGGGLVMWGTKPVDG
ncbi:MAG TPA: class I SAM-dependent methyltransferase [Acidimicrobiales bacterium]|jgi:demethylmenaquinone methyltransferase/2-methoxy-6-polyprenyl-1,4-benzoquinol methylase|nr:class I SAM-dependent methyltransferase [Acidimicrobiales bacterium]